MRARSPRSARGPEDIREVPGDAGKVPEDAGNVPEDAGKVPRMRARSPRNAGEVSEDVGEVPTRVVLTRPRFDQMHVDDARRELGPQPTSALNRPRVSNETYRSTYSRAPTRYLPTHHESWQMARVLNRESWRLVAKPPISEPKRTTQGPRGLPAQFGPPSRRDWLAAIRESWQMVRVRNCES
jgi:hypothetical protein